MKDTMELKKIKKALIEYAQENSSDRVTKVAAGYWDSGELIMAANTIDETLPEREIKNRTELYYQSINHAEYNLLRKLGCREYVPGILYTTCFPCINCQKLLMERGITTVYYIDDHFEKPWSASAHKYAKNSGQINFIKF